MPFKNKDINREYHKDYHKKWYEKNKEKRQLQITKYNENYKHKPAYRYAQYKNGAKKKGLLFEVSIEEFTKIIQLHCYYCEGIGGGIDRLDNEYGYITGNIVPCCSMCNYMKKNYSIEQFIEHCKKISEAW